MCMCCALSDPGLLQVCLVRCVCYESCVLGVLRSGMCCAPYVSVRVRYVLSVPQRPLQCPYVLWALYLAVFLLVWTLSGVPERLTLVMYGH